MSTATETKPSNMKLAGGRCLVSSRLLFKAMAPLVPVISATTVLPILESFLIDVRAGEHGAPNGKMTIVATDLENYFTNTIDVESKESFAFCVSAELLYKFCQFLPDQPIEMEYTKSAAMVKIRADGSMVVTMLAEDADNFPKSPDMPEGKILHKWKFGYSLLIPQLRTALKFVSNDELRPAMTGVYIHESQKHGLTIVATDAHCLYYNSLIEKVPESMKGFARILPPKVCKIITQMFKKGDDIYLQATEEHISFTTGSLTCTSRFIDARYPDYSVVIPKLDTQLYFRRKDLKAFLKIAILFGNRSTNQLVMHITSRYAEFRAEDVDFSHGIDYKLPVFNCNEVSLDYTVAASCKFLLRMIEIDSDEYVKLSTNAVTTQAMIFDDNILVMPLMLNQ